MSKEDEIDIDIMEDLLCRFIVNLPKTEQSTDRLFFHIQAAHWFYTDFYVGNQELIRAGVAAPKLKLKAFSRGIFKHCPFLKSYYSYFDVFYKRFSDYIHQIPVFGGIILNKSLDRVLLVTNYYNTSYSFPKGKINQNETGIECAVREVWEEIGINISHLISEKDFIEYKMGNDRVQKMYIVHGANENEVMKTNTRSEIGRIDWVPIGDIEKSKDKNLYTYISPFIKPLQLWIKDYKEAQKKQGSTQQQQPQQTAQATSITQEINGNAQGSSLSHEELIKQAINISSIAQIQPTKDENTEQSQEETNQSQTLGTEVIINSSTLEQQNIKKEESPQNSDQSDPKQIPQNINESEKEKEKESFDNLIKKLNQELSQTKQQEQPNPFLNFKLNIDELLSSFREE